MKVMGNRDILMMQVLRFVILSASRMENSFVSFVDETVGVVWDVANSFGQILTILCRRLFDIIVFLLIYFIFLLKKIFVRYFLFHCI